jgi:hypothetical protein
MVLLVNLFLKIPGIFLNMLGYAIKHIYNIKCRLPMVGVSNSGKEKIKIVEENKD